MSDAYWNATKPNGMPDHVWKAQQEAKKAEEEAKKKAAEAEAAKKKAEAAKKETSSKSNTANTSSNKTSTTLNSSTFTDEVSKAISEAAMKAAAEAVAQSVANQNYLFYDSIIPQEMVNDYNKHQTEKEVEETIKHLESQKESTGASSTSNKGTGSVVTGGMPIAGFGVAMDKAAQVAVDSGGKKDPITDAFVETFLGSEKMQEKYENAEEGSLAKEKADAALNKYKEKEGISQEVLDQINQLLKDNAPKDIIYTPSGYVGGTYEQLTPQGESTTGNPTTPVTPLTLATTSKEVADYALAIMQAAKGDLGEVVKPEYMQAAAPTTPELRTLEELAKTYGITYDYDSVYKVLNDSVEKQYDAVYERQKQNEAAYYDNATAAQNTLLDTLSRDRSSAVQAGVSKGMQAANALGAMLGVSQQFASNATALSQERGNTAKDYGAALAKAVVDAEKTSNERKTAIMEIAKMLYGYDSEQYVANMDNYNTILTNNASLQQTYMNNQTALQNALASIFNNSAANKISGDANIQSNQLIADANIQASKNTAEANRLAAQYAAEAQRYAAYQAAEASKQAAAYQAQGNVDAYKQYANALIQQAMLSSGQSSLSGYEVPKADGTGDTTNSKIATTPGVAEQYYVDPNTGKKEKYVGLGVPYSSLKLYGSNVRTN